MPQTPQGRTAEPSGSGLRPTALPHVERVPTRPAFDPPRRFAIRSNQHQEGKKDVWYENDYTLAPAGGGTALTKHVTSGVSPVVLFLAALAIKKDAMTSLRNLKAQVESKKA